ncbi:MAG: flotillin domain-containing protein, partial [Myxococcota bacterium]
KLRVEKEEAVVTARRVAEAERSARIEVIDGKKIAEREAVGRIVEAEADRQAAEDRAKAVLTEARAQADAKVMTAEADERVMAVEAEGKRALNEADNALRNEQIELQRALAILKVLPQVVASAVRPLENIDGIKILQGYGTNLPGNGETESSTGLADQVTRAALGYRAQAPVVDALLREVGLVDREKGTLNDVLDGNHVLNSMPELPKSD